MGRLTFFFLGAFQVVRGHQPLTGFESGKVRALLAYLVLEQERPHTRDELAGLLWPDFPNKTARKNLRQALNNLRQTLGDADASPSYLHIGGDFIQWNVASDFWVDTAVFRQLLAACADHPHRHPVRCRSCADRRQQAVALYRGDLLAHFFLSDSQTFEEWLLWQREGLHRQVMPALEQLAAYFEENEQLEQAQRYAARQLELEPWREEAHRQLMRTLAAAGQRSAALAQYHACSSLLEKEFGTRPTRVTQELYARIRATDEESAGYTRLPSYNLPRPLTPFIGRQQELSTLIDLLEQADQRLLTLIGPGGVGKTRLALQAARKVVGSFEDGTIFVNLAHVSSREYLIDAIAQALALPISGQTTAVEQVSNYLGGKEILLLLDEFDHLAGERLACSFLADLLACAPALTILVTSWARLGLSGERVLVLSGLQVVPEGNSVMPGANTAVSDAVALFLQQVRCIRNNFHVTAANLLAINRICRLVEGWPLALELAAAWAYQLTCEEIALEIEQGLHLLAGSRSDGEWSGLYAVFNRSWRLLTAEEQRALAALSVFRGGFEQDAAQEVAGASWVLLAGLVEKSLIRRDDNGRFRIHSLLRQYANEQLQKMGEKENICKQHLSYFMRLAQKSEIALHERGQRIWIRRLETEHGNIQAAFSWGNMHAKGEAASMAASLSLFWFMRGHLYEGCRHCESLYPYLSEWPRPLQGRFLLGYATVCSGHGDNMVLGESLTKEALALYLKSGDEEGLAICYQYLAIGQDHEGNLLKAMSLREQALSYANKLPDKWKMRSILQNVVGGYIEMQDFDQAESLGSQLLGMCREAGDEFEECYVLLILAEMARMRGNNDDARHLLNQVLAIAEELQFHYITAAALQYLGEICLGEKASHQAKRYLAQSAQLFKELGHKGRTNEVETLLMKMAD